MKPKFLFTALTLFCLSSVIQAKDNYSFTVFLDRDSVENSNSENHYGSGIIAVDGAKLYLVTTAHIAQQMDSSAYLICNDKKGEKACRIYLKELNKDSIIPWQYHEYADLAILSIEKRNSYKKLLRNKAVDTRFFIKKADDVTMGKKVETLGFPLTHGVSDLLSPFIYESKIVNNVLPFRSLTNSEMCDFIFIQPCTMQGNDGSPVFFVKDGNITIEGFVHGRVYDDEEQKNNVIFDLVTPAYYFFEIVDKKK